MAFVLRVSEHFLRKFTDVDDFVRRIPIHQQYTANIAELEHLTTAGDVYIGKNVTLKGTGTV